MHAAFLRRRRGRGALCATARKPAGGRTLPVVHLAPAPDLRVVYQSGNAHNPGDPVGAVALTITADGAVQIEHTAPGGAVERAFTGTTTLAVIERILEHLTAAGFPSVPAHRIPAGASLRNLYVECGGQSAHAAPTAWNAVVNLPGYREAYQLLDSITTLVSGGALTIVAQPEAGVAVPAARSPSA